MATLTLRLVKGSRLTYQEVDDNFTNLNTDLVAAEADIVTLSNKNTENLLINGNFRIWQRGTSFTSGTYAADRWRFSFGDGSGTVSRQPFQIGQTNVPGEPQYFFRHARSGASTIASSVIAQRIEGVRTFAGTTATFSFWSRVSSGTKVLTPRIVQSFGTGGSPSSDVTTSGTPITVTTDWQKFTQTFSVPSISGKTIGTDVNDFLQVDVTEVSGFSTFTIDFARCQFEAGSSASDFKERPIQQELELCQRYYYKTFPQETTPAQNAGTTGAIQSIGLSSGLFLVGADFPVTLRSGTGTSTTYNPSAANASARNITDNTDTPVALGFTDRQLNAIPSPTDATDAGDRILVHATVDVEL